jgi:hypothetical protein
LIWFLAVPPGDAAANGVIDSMVGAASGVVLPITQPERSPPALACLSPPRQRNGSCDEEEDEKHEADEGTRELRPTAPPRVVRCGRNAPSTRE